MNPIRDEILRKVRDALGRRAGAAPAPIPPTARVAPRKAGDPEAEITQLLATYAAAATSFRGPVTRDKESAENAREFLYYFQTSVSGTKPTKAELDGGAKGWTHYMRARLHQVQEQASLWCACGGDHARPRDGAKGEFLFDLTWYENADANEYWIMPKVIIEHENLHSLAEFQRDHWKTLLGYAPLRVAIGYCSKSEDRKS